MSTEEPRLFQIRNHDGHFLRRFGTPTALVGKRYSWGIAPDPRPRVAFPFRDALTIAKEYGGAPWRNEAGLTKEEWNTAMSVGEEVDHGAWSCVSVDNGDIYNYCGDGCCKVTYTREEFWKSYGHHVQHTGRVQR